MPLSDRFQAVVSDTINFETGGDKSGAYHLDPSDPGGETKWGISKKAHPTLDIKGLTYKDAVNIYCTQYWKVNYDLIPAMDLTFKVFDMGVLAGIETAITKLQTAIKKAGKTVAVDGNFGPITLTALNILYSEGKGDNLYKIYVGLFVSRINWLTTIKPWLRKYKVGWMKRTLYTFVAKPVIKK